MFQNYWRPKKKKEEELRVVKKLVSESIFISRTQLCKFTHIKKERNNLKSITNKNQAKVGE